MADEVDITQDRIEKELAAQIANTRTRIKSGPSATADGKCAWCKDEDAMPGSAFCSKGCNEDWERHERAKQRMGLLH